MTRQEIETALDAGKLWANMGNGRWWVCRRNGKTQTWKTRPDDYRIPVKAGFRSTGQITPDNARPDVFHIGDAAPSGAA